MEQVDQPGCRLIKSTPPSRGAKSFLSTALLFVVAVLLPTTGGSADGKESGVQAVRARITRLFPADPSIRNLTVQSIDKKRSVLRELAEFSIGSGGRSKVIEIAGTWCGPCVKGYADTVRMARRHKEVAFAIIMVEDDLPDAALLADALALAFNSGQPFAYPSYVVLNAGRQCASRMVATETALIAALDAAGTSADAIAQDDVGAILSALGGKTITVQLSQEAGSNYTLANYVDHIHKATGLQIYCPPHFCAKALPSLSMENYPVAAAFKLICELGGCTLRGIRFSGQDAPLLVVEPKAPLEEPESAGEPRI